MSTATLVPSGEITGKITEPHSWKELLNKYQNEKSTLGFEMPLVARVTREHSDVWRNKQREVDPVTQKFRDHVREQKTEDAEARERTQQLKRAFEKSVEERDVNILTLEPKRSASTSNETNTSHTGTPSTWKNTNAAKPKFKNANEQCKEDTDSQFGKGKRLSLLRERTPYNIITNSYKFDDANRKKREEREFLNKVRHSYEKFHLEAFDPILQRYHSDTKDVEMETTMQTTKQIVADKKLQQLPYHVRHCETACYDMISNELHNPEELEKIETKKLASQIKHINRNQSEYEWLQLRLSKSDLDDARKANRKKDGPVIEFEHQNRYYNPLNNKDYTGVDAVKNPAYLKLKSQVPRTKTIWDYIRQEEQHVEPIVAAKGKLPMAKKQVRTSGFQNINIFKTL